MATRRRRWVLIAFGVVILIIFIGIGAIFAVTAWVQQNVHVEERSDTEAAQEFAGVRKEFGERPPLLEMQDGHPQFTAEHDKGRAAEREALGALNVLAWDAKEERLARVSVPFWVLRMKSGPLRLGAYASGLDDRVQLRIEDIENYGPGVILDVNRPSGDHVLVWVR